ncbi:MAG: RNA polymerase sigma factor [Steroidobacteraceae bacterium]
MHMLEPLTRGPAHAAAQAPGAEGLPDLLLIERARAGERRAIEALTRRYSRRLFRCARSIVLDDAIAEEAVHAAYAAAFADLARYQPNGKFAAWLTRLVVAEAQRLRGGPDRAVGTAAATSAAAGLERAVDALPGVFRTVFVLRMVEGIGGVETAASLDLNDTTVRTRLYRSLRRLAAATGNRVSEARDLFELSRDRGERIVQRVLAQLPG